MIKNNKQITLLNEKKNRHFQKKKYFLLNYTFYFWYTISVLFLLDNMENCIGSFQHGKNISTKISTRNIYQQKKK